jgi:hypothetical protein
MNLSLLLGAALALGQTDVPSAPRAYAPNDYAPSVPVAVPRAQLLPPSGSIVVPTTTAVVADTAVTQAAPAGAHGVAGACCTDSCDTGCHPFRGLFGHRRNDCGGCDTGCRDCRIVCLKPWTCDDLKMECEEPKCHSACGGCRGGFLERLLFCPEEPEEEEAANGNGEKKNGNGKKKNGKEDPTKEARGEKKDGEAAAKEEEEEEEEEDPHGPLMQTLRCYTPGLFHHMEHNGAKLYGWVQGGFTANFDSPRDRLNYAVNFNNRSNDVLLNQAYLVLEKPLDLDKKKDMFHVGYRFDVWYGHDAPFFENSALGLLDNFRGDRLELSRLSEMGLGFTQFYADVHLPVLTERGVDVRIGRFYTYLTYELSPAPSTLFYSHSLEYFNMPYTHTGIMTTVHVGDTLDIVNGVVRGWEVVFEDNNDSCSYHGGAFWTSCDKKHSVALSWITGPEQLNNDDNIRTAATAYYTGKFGRCKEWMFVTGGGVGHEQNGSADPTSPSRDAEWYSYSNYLFYTVNPKLTFGTRFEWYHDDDGNRTAMVNSDFGGARWNRPGYAGNFYNWTVGATYKPYQNLRLRPEIRCDWFNGAAIDGSGSQPFNDQRDQFQTTFGIDAIWEF